MPRRITAVDARNVSGFSRSEFQAVINGLEHYCNGDVRARDAREFHRYDLIMFVVLSDLESRHGMKRKRAAELFDELRAALWTPRLVNRDARLIVLLDPPKVNYIEGPQVISEGTVLPLGPVFDRVDSYLGAEDVRAQPSLPISHIAGPQQKQGGEK